MRPLRRRLRAFGSGGRGAAAGLLLVVLLAGACAPQSDIRYARPLGAIHAPTLEPIRGQTLIQRFDPPGAGDVLELNLGLLARNPNDFGVRLERVEYRLLLPGGIGVEGHVETDAYLEAGASAPVRFLVEVHLPPRRPLLQAIARAFAGEPMPFRLEGRLRFTSPGYRFETRERPLTEGVLAPRETVEPPELRIEEDTSRAFELRPGVPVVQVAMRARNPGEIGYFLSGKDLRVSVGGSPLATDDLEPLPLPAGETRHVELLFYPDPDELDGDALEALRGAVGGVATPVAVSGELFMDVLGVDTFPVEGGLALRGFLTGSE